VTAIPVKGLKDMIRLISLFSLKEQQVIIRFHHLYGATPIEIYRQLSETCGLFKASEESGVVSSAQTKRCKSERQLAFLHICDMCHPVDTERHSAHLRFTFYFHKC
jgi:hypothetical protein